MKNTISLPVLTSVCIAALTTPVLARDFQAPEGWTSDCVGRLQISMPGPVDVAAYSAKAFSKALGIPSINSPFEFNDGQVAPYSKGETISQSLNPEQISGLLILAKQRIESIEKRVKSKGHKDFFEEINTEPKRGVGHRYNDDYNVIIVIGNHLHETTGGDNGVSWSETKKDLDATLNIQSRAIGELPTQPGICMPYAFKADTGHERRSIASTWRLKEHPDITVMLQDEKAEPLNKYINPERVTPVRKVEFFWEQNYRGGYAHGEYLWFSMHDVKLANVKGKGIPMKMTRKDGTIDYGYYAAANGEVNAQEDTPNVEFYVLQHSNNAISRGIKPLTETEFLKLTEEIAASIKHRPVSNP